MNDKEYIEFLKKTIEEWKKIAYTFENLYNELVKVIHPK